VIVDDEHVAPLEREAPGTRHRDDSTRDVHGSPFHFAGRSGETGNLAVLKKDEWNVLVDLSQSGQIGRL